MQLTSRTLFLFASSTLLVLTTAIPAMPLKPWPIEGGNGTTVNSTTVTVPAPVPTSLPLQIIFAPFKTNHCVQNTATHQDSQPPVYYLTDGPTHASNCVTSPYNFTSYLSNVPPSVTATNCMMLLYSGPKCSGDEWTVYLAPGANCEIPSFSAGSAMMDCGIGH